MMDTLVAPLSGVLVGCGYTAGFQLSAWSRIETAQIVAVASLNREDADRCASEHGVPAVFDDYGDMLDEVRPDFVDIATPPETHRELVALAAERGVHILCQKPMATSRSEIDDMVRACESNGVSLTINENARFQPWFRELGRISKTGRLGDIRSLRIESRARLTLPHPDFSGQEHLAMTDQLAIMELGVHHLDTARFLLGEADLVFAITQRASKQVAGEDTALIVARHEGAASTIDISWANSPWPPSQDHATWSEVRIEGDDGIAHLSYAGLLEVLVDGHLSQIQFSEHGIDEGYEAMQRHFVDCLLQGVAAETSARQTIRTMDLVFAAYESAKRGVAVVPGESTTIDVS